MEAVRNKKASQKCLDSGRKIDGTLPIPDKNLAEYIAAAGAGAGPAGPSRCPEDLPGYGGVPCPYAGPVC